MKRSVLLSVLVAVFATGVWAQSTAASANASPDDVQHSELSVQVSGVLTRNTNNAPTTHLATNSAGLLVGYRVHLNHWEALEVEYGYTSNGQRYFTAPTAGNTSGFAGAVTARMHQFIANEVVTTPRLFGFLQPFVLAGGGALYFRPRSDSLVAANNQWRGAFNYGAGVDFHIMHLGARAEYQGLIFKVPNFGNPLLNVNKFTHVAQPSVGLVFTF
ncbi:MAG TPA: hypothetical protein VN515_10130 [Terriglobales bacterium]|nr:hypothetical protein [Terriglobales bacterium]